MTTPDKPSGGSISTGGALAQPTQQPKMTDVDIRIACVDFAVRASAQSTVPTSEKDITASAREFYTFITEGNADANPSFGYTSTRPPTV